MLIMSRRQGETILIGEEIEIVIAHIGRSRVKVGIRAPRKMPVVAQEGPYGGEGFIRQALAPLPNFSGQYPVIGSWVVDHSPCGLSIREDENPITGNTSRFLPHAIL